MLTAVVFIVILGLLIFVHEFGHFITARKSGIKAEEFGFGFPPRIFGIQMLKGKKVEKISEEEKMDIEISDYKTPSGEEVIKEVITDRIREVDKEVKVKKWRFIWGKRDTEEEWKEEPGLESDTIYSINWIPLGGFVRIKGEDGSMANDPDSFAAKSAKKRIVVLAAGVIMNFLLAWVLISAAMMIGAPQPIEEGQPSSGTALDSKIQVSQVTSGSPAEASGLKIGDEVVRCVGIATICNKRFTEIKEVQDYISSNKGKEITLSIKRGSNFIDLKSTPRIDYPEDQGPLGISLTSTQIIQYPWYEAISRGLVATYNLIVLIVTTLFGMIKNIFIGQKVAVDVSGPIGIALLTKQVTELGLVYILQFAAILSINLGIINILPFPALDGGRILFILIEKIKGSPVSQKVEQAIHSSGFILLIMLMLFITFRDVVRNNIIDKIRNIF
jgi:regulator of sigma E protease